MSRLSRCNRYMLCVLYLLFNMYSVAQTNGCSLSQYFLVWEPSEVDFEHGDWTLVFEDNFNGSTIDESKWFTCGDGWLRIHGRELQIYEDENVELDDGVLHLIARKEPGRYKITTDESDTTTGYYEFTSGWIQTKSEFQYGLFEIRCKIPYGRGFWPAFWLYGLDEEIDVFEFDCEYPREDNTCIHQFSGANRYSCHDYYNEGPSFDEDYHVFSLEWDECAIVYRVDGYVIRKFFRYVNTLGQEIPNYANLPQHEWCLEKKIFPTKPKHLFVNLAIQCGNDCEWGGLPPDNNTQFPSSFDVDYVRVYKRSNPTKDIEVCSLDSQKGNYYTGRHISIGNCPILIDSNQTFVAVATNEIVLKPGLEIARGAFFDAHIIDARGLSPLIQNEVNVIENVLGENSVDDNNVGQLCRLIQVFPNPAHGFLTISLLRPASEFFYIKIVDAAGKSVFVVDRPINERFEVALPKFESEYYVIVETKNGGDVIKLIVQ